MHKIVSESACWHRRSVSVALAPLPKLTSLAKLTPLAILALLAGCGGVQIAPTLKMPHALVNHIPAHVGLVVAGDMRNYSHKETRGGGNFAISLGAGHQKFSEDVMAALFDKVSLFPDLESARAAQGLAAIFEPRIEQFSFATAQETGGVYYAVTIKYRIALFTAAGEPVDAFTLTGYGNSLATGMSGGAPLDLAAQAAMRDAAAKFLVQFPEQATAKQLASAQPLLAQVSAANRNAADPIEAVPIK